MRDTGKTGAVVVWLERLGYDAESRHKALSLRLGLAMRRLENSVCPPSSNIGTFFQLGKDKAVKGEGWAPPFISCAQLRVGL